MTATVTVRIDDVGRSVDVSTLLAVISHTSRPMLVLAVPSQIILAASPGAHELLAHPATSLIGRSFEDFTEGRASDAMSLLAARRINAYETTETLRSSGLRRRLRITELPSVGPRRHALAVLEEEDVDGLSWLDDVAAGPVLGSTDATLLVDAVSSSILTTLGYRPDTVVGTSLLTLIAPEDIADVLSALGRIPQHEEGLALPVDVLRADGVRVPCRLFLLPRSPAPRCAFALLVEPVDGPADGPADGWTFARLGRNPRKSSRSQAVSPRSLRTAVDLARLSGREIEVVTLLVAGDRVPKIAKRLFLSEGTVRNNLSSVFGKLGVANQQELVDLLRQLPQSPDEVPGRDTSSLDVHLDQPIYRA